MTEDPVKDGVNWYVYCGNNPMVFVDPTGLVYVPNDMSNATDEQRVAYKEGTARANEIAIFEYRTEGLSDYVFQYFQQTQKLYPGPFEGLDKKSMALIYDLLLETAQLYMWKQQVGENWDMSKFGKGMWDQLAEKIEYFGNDVALINQFGAAGYAIIKGTQGALTGLGIANLINENGLFNVVDSTALDIVNYVKNNPEEAAGRTTSEIIQSILIVKGVGKLSEIAKGAALVDDATGVVGKQQLRPLVKSMRQSYKGSTRLGHAISKHAGRKPGLWGKITGKMSTWHKQGLKQFKEIFYGSGKWQKVPVKGKTNMFFWEKRIADGRGIRLNMDYTFKGFVD